METESGIRTWQWVVTVIVIIILIIAGYYLFKSNEAVAPVTTNTENSTTTENANPINRVVISDQFPGNIVYLSSVQLDRPGFVAIQKDNNGAAGDVIGYQYFDKGINPGKVTLTSPTKEGGMYYAVLYSDTDGDKKFDIKKDSLIKDASGNAIMKPFRATSSITEIKG